MEENSLERDDERGVGLQESDLKAHEDELTSEETKEITIYDIESPKYVKKNVNLTYMFLFYINMSLNFDHGAMPAATKNLEVTLDLNA